MPHAQSGLFLKLAGSSLAFDLDRSSRQAATYYKEKPARIGNLQVHGIMPVHIIQDLMGSQLPKTLQSIPIPTLKEKSDYAGKCVKGRVVFKGPLVSRGENQNCILKTVIQEDVPQQKQTSNTTSINVVLFGGLATDFSLAVNQGDIVVLSGFTISPSPTVNKDKLHPCNLHLDGTEAYVYVCAAKASVGGASEVCSITKYTYVPLNELKHGSVVNIYAVVTFFKLPFPTKGTDYCSTLKLADQSGAKVGCTIFCGKKDDHPKVFKIGDVIRLHRVKAHMFGGSMTLLTYRGWSAVTFDGTVGSSVVPRTSSKTFHFGEEDSRMVMALRKWAAGESPFPRELPVPVSAVAPGQYFNLTCQLLAKACIDSACTLLKVWDGTRCSYPLLTVPVEPEALEGGSSAVTDRQNLIANVLVYDNHVEVARALQPGMFLCIYNLHAVQQSVTGEANGSQKTLSFHLHGGTSYGRGLCALPPDNPDVLKLKRALQTYAEQMEDDMMDDLAWFTPSQCVNGGLQASLTVRKCTHSLQQVPLLQVKNSAPSQFFHVRAQVKSYQPKRLYQSLKLFCSRCKTIEEIPDPMTLRARFQEALMDNRPCQPAWAVNLSADTEDPRQKITLYMSSKKCPEDSDSKLIFVQGATFPEMCRLSSGQDYMVPVRSSRGKLVFFDKMVPLLFRGKRHFYGCRQCSKRKLVKPAVERSISEALGIQLMQYVSLLKLELDDGTATLEALLWENTENFFHVSADDMVHSQDAQNRMQKIMDTLQPADSSQLQRPWLDFCLSLYAVNENDQSQVHCQIVNTQAEDIL